MPESQLTIPKRYHPGFRTFARLSDAQLDALASGVVSGSPAAEMRELSHNLTATVGVESDDLTEVLEMLASIQGAQAYFDIPVNEFVRGIVSAAQDEENIKLPAGRRDKIEQALQQIVRDSTAIRVASKARELRGEMQRRLCSGNCRVVTDIRPIFSSEVGKKPDAAMVVHTLKVAYHEHSGDDVLEFYVAMTGEDVRVLQDALQRAILKEGSIRGWISATSTPLLGVED